MADKRKTRFSTALIIHFLAGVGGAVAVSAIPVCLTQDGHALVSFLPGCVTPLACLLSMITVDLFIAKGAPFNWLGCIIAVVIYGLCPVVGVWVYGDELHVLLPSFALGLLLMPIAYDLPALFRKQPSDPSTVEPDHKDSIGT
ncbi:MAG: hypothetical protein WC869_07670 [Phycisphaerae bacterium]|jgi:hypothetical protein